MGFPDRLREMLIHRPRQCCRWQRGQAEYGSPKENVCPSPSYRHRQCYGIWMGGEHGLEADDRRAPVARSKSWRMKRQGLFAVRHNLG